MNILSETPIILMYNNTVSGKQICLILKKRESELKII